MNKVKTYKSDAFAAIHETMSGMYDAGVIDKKTMRQFDEGCLTPVHAFSATEIKALREREEVSQTVFALYIFFYTRKNLFFMPFRQVSFAAILPLFVSVSV